MHHASALKSLEAAVLRDIKDAEERGYARGYQAAVDEARREVNGDLPIDRQGVAERLGCSTDYVDDLRRKDARFPVSFEIVPNRPVWLLKDIVAYRDMFRKGRCLGVVPARNKASGS